MRLDLFVKLKYQSNTKILYVSIKYSVRDLLLLTHKVNNVDISALLLYIRKPTSFAWKYITVA